MPPKSLKIDWLALEHEIREILRDGNFDDPNDQLIIIDEIMARHTKRGNEINVDDADYHRLSNQFPAYFTWDE